MISNSKKSTIVYVAGYGRSGSTLLSMLLNTLPSVYNVGELDNLFATNENLLPEFWKEKRGLVIKSEKEKLQAGIRFSGISWIWKQKRGWSLFNKYWSPIMRQIDNELQPIALVDGSKTTNATFLRPFYYKKDNREVKVVHLVRDLSGVVESFTKGKNSSNSTVLQKPKRGGAFRAIFNWTFTNIATRLYYKRLLHKKNYYLLSYEDLMNDYKGEMKKLLVFLELDPYSEILKKKVTLSKDISFSGNRVRLNKEITIKPYPKTKTKGIIGIFVFIASNFCKLFLNRG